MLAIAPGDVDGDGYLDLVFASGFASPGRQSRLYVNLHRQIDTPLLALSLLGTEIYAPTAAILHQFSEVAVHGRTTRVAHFEQPRFAWR